MGSNRDTAADVAADEVHVLILLAHGVGVADAVLLLIQGVTLALTEQFVEAADALHIVQLVNIGGIHAEHLAAVDLLHLLGDLRAKGVGVTDGEAGAGMLHELVVGSVDAALEAHQTAAAGGESIHTLQRYAGGIDLSHDGLHTVGQLIGDLLELLQLLGSMVNIGAPNLLIVLKQGDLGAGGTGVDDKDLHQAFSSITHPAARRHSPRTRRWWPCGGTA